MKSIAERATTDRPVLVIGGGVIGVCCAYYLQLAGVPVLLAEAATVGSGASSGNLGLVAVSHSIPLASPGVTAQAIRWMLRANSPFSIDLPPSLDTLRWLWQFFRATRSSWFEERAGLLTSMCLESVELFQDLYIALSVSCRPTGTLEVFRHPRSIKELQRQIAAMNTAGIEVDVKSRADVHALVPYLKPDVYGGAFYPQDSTVAPLPFTRAVSSQLCGSTMVHEHARVTTLRVEHNLVTAAEFGPEPVRVAAVVLAGGHESNLLLAPLGLHLPLQPARGFTVDCLPENGWKDLAIMFAEARLLATWVPGRIRIGGYLHLAKASGIHKRKLSAELLLHPLEGYLQSSIVQQLGETASPIWSGYRPCSPDGLPILGPVQKLPNLFCATGHGMLGLTLGPITGVRIAQMLTGELNGNPLSHLSPNRFDLNNT